MRKVFCGCCANTVWMSRSRFRLVVPSGILLLSAALALAVSCGEDSAPPPVRSPERGQTIPANPDTSRTPLTPDPTVLPGLTPAMVTRVVDGDTIVVEIEGQEYRVRYIGIDTPETVDPRRPVGCFGKEASDRNRQLVDGKVVGLEKDVSETDSFGRLLHYVWVGDQMVNATLVEEGYALASTYPPDVRYADRFASLQTQARENGRGLWGAVCNSATPSPGVAGLCDFSNTAEPMIKGNISIRTGEKIYHVPGGEFYDETVIDAAKGERFFCTEGEAVAAGWRKSLR